MGRLHFRDISPQAWAHPQDLSGQAMLKRIPGLTALERWRSRFQDAALKDILGCGFEPVTATTYPKIEEIYAHARAVLDVPQRYPLYVIEQNQPNAGVIGVHQPSIVLTRGAVTKLSDTGIMGILGHELSHILLNHLLFFRAYRLLMLSSWLSLPLPITSPVRGALRKSLWDWRRMSELSADRAELLVTQDVDGFFQTTKRISLSEPESVSDERFRELLLAELGPEVRSWDDVMEHLSVFMESTHPLTAIRVRSIETWAQGPDYQAILSGTYARRSRNGEVMSKQDCRLWQAAQDELADLDVDWEGPSTEGAAAYGRAREAQKRTSKAAGSLGIQLRRLLNRRK
ncbi:MAG: M48 family metallopeptidase [Myxococcota bacterium]